MRSSQPLRRAGADATGPFTVSLSPEDAGWAFSGLRVLDLPAGGRQDLETGADELLVLPLTGACTVTVTTDTGITGGGGAGGGGSADPENMPSAHTRTFALQGRADVFSAVTDHLYVPMGATLTITSAGGGRFALPSARASRRLPVSHRRADEVRVELRGAGTCSRQVNNYALGNDLDTDHLLVCEVLTPGGNWSSYPPHKHDVHSEVERELEEIYYFEVAPGPDGPGFAFHRTYGTADRPLELTEEVRTGDVVLIPHGYHGPSMAAPGYDLYYLNVMAGPASDQQWLMTDDPRHHWIRDTWADQEIDPRLPMTSTPAEGREGHT
ncbi:5-deoxy-glucuronate isomerase [Occultella glacieicola]|uniref:5-deoxy-glucuronate isomerase n=1 Tax=Occultella glacieicola TaxID=2518684 RepID=A0ABY2E2L4_9MICO|nr:5-deoxy-glucuronate isomerase [Occultella glacieicola]